MSGGLPAWSLHEPAKPELALPRLWPGELTRDWAWGGATGAGVRVAIVDSGVEQGHPLVGAVQESVAVVPGEHGEPTVVPSDEGDLVGHGTACAGIVRALAPACELLSVRVLGAGAKGSGKALLAGLRWAVERRADVINLSLSTTKSDLVASLHELTDAAYFDRLLVVAAANNLPVEGYPWRFAAVLSVGSHGEDDPWAYYSNPAPPVELFARGTDVEAAWVGGSTLRVSGNSFATPHVAALCALIRSKHPWLTPFQVKTVLRETASNASRDA